MRNWIDTTVDSFERDERERDRRPLTEKADPLALSWVAYYVWQKNPRQRWVPWNDLEVHEHDREMAKVTRRYYRDRLAMRALRGTEPTKFAQDLYDICNDGIMRECHRGMLYRLPYFYVEDINRDELISDTSSQPRLANLPGYLTERQTRKLTRARRIFHSRRVREIMEYWFYDVETDNAVLWPVAYDNPLRSMLEYWWQSDMPALINARWQVGHDRSRDFRYWQISEPEIRFE